MLLLALSVITSSEAQKPDIIPPSPEAASLGKFGDIPVSNYTGIPSISIPIYTLAANKYSLPIALNYHSGGIKVSEEAGWVGLGWSLAGGAISRTIKGLDDLGLGGYPFAPTPNASDVNYLTSVADGTNDSEPDIFFFNFPGKSGKFVLGQSSGSYQAKLLSQEKLNISYNSTARAWTIVTEDGIRYIFGAEEYVIPASGMASDPATAVSNLISSSSVVTSWHLSRIILVNGESIYFDYETSPPAYKSLASINQLLRYPYATTGNPSCAASSVPQISYLSSRNTFSGVYLKKISYGDFYIDFISEDRIDLEPVTSGILPQRLKEVKVFESVTGTPRLVKHVDFQYSYFNNSLSGYSQKRLKLISIQEKNGSTLIPPYTFEYYTSLTYSFELPEKNSASQDLWGFFNGKDNSSIYSTKYSINIQNSLVPPISVNVGGVQITDTGADRSPNEEASKLGVLKAITYPTGGKTEFEHQAHEYYDPWTENVVTHQNAQLFRYGPLISNPPAVTTEATLDFSTQTSNIDVAIYGAIYCYNFQELGTSCTNRVGHYGDIYQVQPDNSEVLYLSLPISGAPDYTKTETALFNYTLPPGKYIVRTRIQNDAWVVQMDVDYDLPTGSTVSHNNKIAGGLRIKTISSNPIVSAPIQITQYNYETTPGSSSGLLMNPYSEFHFNELLNVFCDVNNQGTVSYLARRSWNNFPMGSGAQGSHIGYGLVTVKNGNDAVSGKSIFEFTNEPEDIDLSIRIPDETTFQPNQNGLMLSKLDYKKNADASFSKVNQVENQYAAPSSLTQTIQGIKVYSVNINGTNIPGIAKPYYYNSERWNLNKETNTAFETDSKFTRWETDYVYENPDHFQITKMRTTQSDGSIEETNFKYAHDYLSVSGQAAYFQKMVDQNMISMPIETTTIKEKSPSDRKYINASLTTYKAYTGPTDRPEIILPYKIFAFKGLGGAVDFTAYPGTSDDIASASYFEKLKYTNYDQKGNPLSLVLNNVENLSYLWSYKGYYPVAEIRNADFSSVSTALISAGTNHATLSASTSSTDIKSKIDALRSSMTTAHVSGYTYKPLTGIETITDAYGKTIANEYDVFNRLIAIRNNNTGGPIRKTFCYNYAGQSVPCSNISPSGIVTAPTISLISISAPLPVSLIEFTARKVENFSALSWTTTEETKSERFEIERSQNGKKWEKIGSVSAGGESNEELKYSFDDQKPLKGENLYRLKMIDTDNIYAYSNIQSVSFEKDGKVTVYPNPATIGNDLNLLTDDLSYIKSIVIYDTNGRIVLKSAPTKQINVRYLSVGLYVVKITYTDGSTSSHRIVKQ